MLLPSSGCVAFSTQRATRGVPMFLTLLDSLNDINQREAAGRRGQAFWCWRAQPSNKAAAYWCAVSLADER